MKFWYTFLGVGILGVLLVGEMPTTHPEMVATQNTGSASARVSDGLVALYDFRADRGDLVRDRSGVGEPADLHISDPKAVRWGDDHLEIRGKTLIQTKGPATKIIDAVRQSGSITVETWFTSADLKQAGPARLVSLSRDSSNRNFTLGQEKDRIEARLRTTRTSGNGLPALQSKSKSVTTKLTHLVYTRDQGGAARIYLDGKLAGQSTIAGDVSNWDKSFRLALGNELSNDRPWRGKLHLVAIYDRALPEVEVGYNFRAGPRAEPISSARLFETRVAPIFAKHCLECHDAAITKGKLDLSRDKTALASGRKGKLFVAGKAEESLLWDVVETDSMPHKRSPLSDEDKRALRQWIDAGGEWSVPFIDPANYALDGRRDTIWIQRLTIPEYIETVRAALGVDIADDARKLLPQDIRADGFSNTAYNLTVDLGHIEAYARLAELVVDRLEVPKFVAEHTQARSLSDRDVREAISKVGKWLLRGPLEPRELEAFANIVEAVKQQAGDFTEAMTYVIEAMLQSPRFVYRVEKQRGSGSARDVGPYELASRMSYILWGAPPDRELMRAADANELNDPARVEAQVRRMLQDPRTIERSTQFVSDWLNLNRLANLRPDAKMFPKWNAQLAADMREETLRFFQEVVWERNRPISELFNAQVTFATPELARHYGLTPKGPGMQRYDLSGVSARGGVLTQGSTLTVGGDEASMVARGLFVLHDILRGEVKDPPPCVNTTPVSTREGLSRREIAQTRVSDANCGGCHARFEPLAYGLEKFDGVGGSHETDEHGNKLREDGEIFFPGGEKAISYESAAQLMNLLAESSRVRETITWKVTQFALGRPLVSADAPIIAKIHEMAWQEGGTYAALIKAVIMSDLILKARTENNP